MENESTEENKEFWICRTCAGAYHIPLDTSNTSRIGTGRVHLVSKMGPCPMCSEFRQLVKAEPLKESRKQEGNYAIAVTLEENRDR